MELQEHSENAFDLELRTTLRDAETNYRNADPKDKAYRRAEYLRALHAFAGHVYTRGVNHLPIKSTRECGYSLEK